MKKKSNLKKGLFPYLILFISIITMYYIVSISNNKVHVLRYDDFLQKLNKYEVSELDITAKENTHTYEVRGKLKDYKENETFFVRAPLSEEVIKRITLSAENADSNMKVITKINPESSTLFIVLANLLPTLLLGFGVFYLFTRQLSAAGGNANKSFDFGKSKAKLNTDENKVTFKDVAGLHEEKEEVNELIDFLKTPKRFQKLGARIPKGVLLEGPPGTGKTLLAKAVAGEADVPFYFISGSEFVELFVGVGASRVRDMFKEAKRNAPCLIFIDEIDAVGRQRGTGLGGGHDEREQTLNQLLTEMDGFGVNEGIIVIAATNRSDVLDPALLRPGRFDRQVTVDLPDKREREEILYVHAKNKILSKEVELSNVSQRTPGFSGAALENLMNEAALLAVRRRKEEITMDEIDEAIDRVIGGPAKVTRKYTEKERILVAYHEAGHAVLGIKLSDAFDVQKITIVPRGSAGGYNLMTPKEETYFSTKKELEERIAGFLAGRVAEEIMFDEVSTGAYSDFRSATKIARAMVTEYGMSDLGAIQYESVEGGVFLGRDYNKSKNFSNEVAHEIDKEVKKIIDAQYNIAREVLLENKDLLDLIANTLLDKETITKEEIEQLVEFGKLKETKKDEEINLSDLTVVELKELAKEKGLKGYSKLTKDELIEELEK